MLRCKAALLLCVAMSAQPQLQRPAVPDMALAQYVAGTKTTLLVLSCRRSEEPVWEVKHRGAWVGQPSAGQIADVHTPGAALLLYSLHRSRLPSL